MSACRYESKTLWQTYWLQGQTGMCAHTQLWFRGSNSCKLVDHITAVITQRAAL